MLAHTLEQDVELFHNAMDAFLLKATNANMEALLATHATCVLRWNTAFHIAESHTRHARNILLTGNTNENP